ncbi:MAG TPA: lysophospholipid acyltransferase family protein [Sphingobium sp.]|nr:lysophospholipid acyltransferase family protein [Sphingobium sp.]
MDSLSPLGWASTALRSALFALLFYGLTVVLLLAGALCFPFGQRAIVPVARLWARLHWLLARAVLGQRVVVEGAVPHDARFIVMKHESMFETLDVIRLFGAPVVAAKRELVEIPLWGEVARRYGLIPVDRKAGASALRAVRAAALAAMEAGRTVVFFPEGTRVAHGKAPPLKAGFAGLYAVLGVPVVPIAVDSGRLAPRNGFIKRSGIITYRVGAPVPPGLPRAEAQAQVHAAINALNSPAEGGKADSV